MQTYSLHPSKLTWLGKHGDRSAVLSGQADIGLGCHAFLLIRPVFVKLSVCPERVKVALNCDQCN